MNFQTFSFADNIDWNALEEAETELTEAKETREINFATIDAETDPFDGENFVEPFIWGFFDGENYEYFEGPYCTEALAERVSNYKGTVFAHNGGKFDFHFLIQYLEKEKGLTIINGRIAKAKLGKATLQDSYCILPVRLSALEKDDFDYDILRKDKRHLPGNPEKIKEYLRSDCIYLHKYIKLFIDEFGMNLTVASAALKQWQKMGGIVPKSDFKYYDKFLPYYYGGRVEPFEAGVFEGQFKIYDIKSAYPTAMQFEHPIGTEYYETKRPLDSLIETSLLEVKCKSKGAFPLRTKDGLFFPETEGIFKVTGWEFVKALENGTISEHRILNAYVFEEVCSFKSYVDYFYAMKNEAERTGDKGKRTLSKLFLNSLYGKFAMNPRNYEEYYLDDYGAMPRIVKDGEPQYNEGPVYGDLQLFGRDLPAKKWKFLNVVTAASITGWVRAYLWDSIQKCERVLYCDTDSIICVDGSALPQGKDLGNWECEGAIDKIAIAGKKMYAAWNGKEEIKKACKGVNLSFAEIERVARGEVVRYESIAESFSLKQPKRFVSRDVKRTAKKFQEIL